MGKNSKIKASNTTMFLLILIALVASAIGVFAWARLREKTAGTATAQVARWSFKIVDGIVESSGEIDFAVTRTDENPNVVEGNLAPGTYGEFEIGIDARGTETILEYKIEAALTNKPTNLKLYSDSEKTSEISVTDNILSLSGFMSLEDVKEIKVQKIYWEWPYQTGKTEDEQLENDLLDSEFLGKTMTMDIAVTGTEVLEEPRYLANEIKVGDYVNYDANSNGLYSVSTDTFSTGTTDGVTTFSSSDVFSTKTPGQWRVWSIDKNTGTIEIIPAEPTPNTLTLKGAVGFMNSVIILPEIANIYGHGKGSIGARSMTIADIDKYSTFDKTTIENKYSSTGYWGGTRTFTSGTFFKEIFDEESKNVTYENEIVPPGTVVTMTAYSYLLDAYISDEIRYELICKNSTLNIYKSYYWLNSRGASFVKAYASYGVGAVTGISAGNVGGSGYNSNMELGVEGNTHSYAIVPVVTLRQNIQTTGQDENGVWQLDVD